MTQTAEHEPSLDIQESISQIIMPGVSVEAADEALHEVIDCVAERTHDLQAGRLLTAEVELHLLWKSFLRDPLETVTSEVENLSRLSERRSVAWRGATEFITRSATLDGIDTYYRNNGSWVQAESRLQGQLSEPCVVTTFSNRLVVSEKKWQHGQWNYNKLDPAESERGHKLYTGFLASTLWAAHLAMTRPAAEREVADADARRQLVAMHTSERGAIVTDSIYDVM